VVVLYICAIIYVAVIYSLSRLPSYFTLYDFICMKLVLLNIKHMSKRHFIKHGK